MPGTGPASSGPRCAVPEDERPSRVVLLLVFKAPVAKCVLTGKYAFKTEIQVYGEGGAGLISTEPGELAFCSRERASPRPASAFTRSST